MRYWLGRPLLMLAGIMLVLGGISAYWLHSGPSAAEADDNQTAHTAYHRQVDKIINDMENGR
ncbi:MAG: hypothetical protein KAV00_18025 [Phycisphaerae bacterium]|nr:hypothetical protein [Phycisphaerae bacterium]